MDFILSIMVFTSITVIAVTGIFVISGLTGLFSLGQAAFMAIGAYVAGVLAVNYHLSFPVAGFVAVLVGLLAGAIVGLPAIRLRRDYIALATFGFGEAIAALLNQSVSITGGAMGLSGIPKKTGIELAVISALICIFIVRNFKYSKFGRQCIALREDELAAKSMGINVTRVKMVAFLLSAAITAYAGVLYAFYTTYVEPAMFVWTKSAEWIIIIYFGGINSLTGAVFAGILLTSLPEVLRFAAEWRGVIYCIVVIFILNFRPSGVFGEYELSFNWFRKWWKHLKEKKGVMR